MKAVLQTIHNSLACCCLRRSSTATDGDDSETEEDVDLQEADALLSLRDEAVTQKYVHEETSQLMQASMKDRIEGYKQAIAKQKQQIAAGSAPTPYKRHRSTSNMISQFESMSEESSRSVSSSSRHRELRTPLMDSSNQLKLSLSSSISAIQTSIRNSVKDLSSCAVCLESIYPTDSTVHSYDRSMHAACFTCRLCASKLKHHPLEVYVELPGQNDNGLYCVCAKCQFETMHGDKPKVLASVAGEKITPENEELGDVEGVKDAIGDELEEILLEKTLPRCQVCAGDFLNYNDRVCIVGQVKYHKQCWETGKPRTNLADRQLIPYQAAKYLPERWILRLTMDEATDENNTFKRRPVATLFFVWKNRLEDFRQLVANEQLSSSAVLRIQLALDDQALGNPNYKDECKQKTRASITGAADTLRCELIGNPLSTIAPASTCANTSNYILLKIQSNKFHVNHTVTLRLPKFDSQTLDLARAELSIGLQQQEQFGALDAPMTLVEKV